MLCPRFSMIFRDFGELPVVYITMSAPKNAIRGVYFIAVCCGGYRLYSRLSEYFHFVFLCFAEETINVLCEELLSGKVLLSVSMFSGTFRCWNQSIVSAG